MIIKPDMIINTMLYCDFSIKEIANKIGVPTKTIASILLGNEIKFEEYEKILKKYKML